MTSHSTPSSCAAMTTALLSLLLPLFSLLLALFLRHRHRHRHRHRALPLPPGPRALPLLGNLLSLRPDLHSSFAALARTHGPIFKLRLGYKLAVVISSPPLARQLLKDNDVVFANRDVPDAGRVATGGHDVVWAPYGPEWRMLRKVCVVKMLSNATLDSVYHLRRRELRKMVAHLYGRVGSRVDVGEQVFSVILNVVTNMLWGGSVEGEAERERVGSEFRELVSEMTVLLGKPNVSDFYPALARFDLQGVARDMGRIARRFDEIFDKLIEQRQQESSDGESRDFLHYLLRLREEEDSTPPLTMAHVKALLLDMVVGGSDTSSNSIEFAMAEVLKQPEIARKAQEELEEVVGKDSVVEESHIKSLPYLRAVMKESLRLHPVLPLLVPHTPSRDCTLDGYTVPTGSRVFVNVWAIHRDPAVWDHPLRFDPERFLKPSATTATADFGSTDLTYFPFGSGRRVCAGVAMAERMVLYTLATLLHSFHWDVSGGDVDVSEKFGIVLKKNKPLVAVPTPRLSHPSLYSAELPRS